jgi:MFS family permease
MMHVAIMDNHESDPVFRHRPFGKSYFLQRIIFAWELPSIMRKHIYTGMMGSIHGTLVSGILFVYFGTAIGLTEFQWGLLAGISSWVIAAQPLSAILTERTGNRKRIWFLTALADRSLRFAGILVSFVLWINGVPASAVFLLVAVCAANFFGTIGLPPWLSWLADIIPEDEHASFWGRRSAWVSMFTVAVLLLAGLIADAVPEDRRIYAAVAIFAVGSTVGIIDLFIHGTIPEPRMIRPGRDRVLSQFLKPLRDPGFRPWIVFNCAWTFSMTLGGALSTLYMVEHLGMKDNILGGIAVTSGIQLLIATFIGARAGRLVDAVGVRRMLYAGHLLWALLPIFWLISTPQIALFTIALASVSGGLGSTIATIAANKLITRYPPPESRAMYIAVSTSLGNLAGGLGPIIAGFVLRSMAGATVAIGPFEFGAFRFLFLASLILRMISALSLIPRIGDIGRSRAPAS